MSLDSCIRTALAGAVMAFGSVPPACAGVLPQPTPILVADVNCDGVGSAADFTAAIIVADDGTNFRDCHGANSFRDRILTEQDFLPMQHDLFGTFNAPFTPTPTRTATATATRAVTDTPTRTASPSPSATSTPSATPTPTNTALPAATSTPTATRTSTATPTLPPTATPTGLAQQLSGTWFANWQNRICYLDGQPFDALQDVTYRLTAVGGRLDIEIVDGDSIGRDLALIPVSGGAMVTSSFVVPSGRICQATGVEQKYEFDYELTFRTNGTGSATARWAFGVNTNCALCRVTDNAVLQRLQ